MAHLCTYTGSLIEDATERIVEVKRENQETVKKKILTFKLFSKSVLFPNKPKYYEVAFWFAEDDEIKQLPYLKKGKLVSLMGEEFCKPSLFNNTLYTNYHLYGFRGSLHFLSPSEKEDNNNNTKQTELTIPEMETVNYLNE